MGPKAKLAALALIATGLIAVFLFIHVGEHWDYVLPRRSMKVFAIVLTGGAIAFSTLVFQTMTHNRILTPSLIGLDSLYLLIQTVIIFAFGSTHLTIVNRHLNFVISVGLMIVFAGVLYRVLFKREGQNIYFLLLVGIILGTLFQNLSTFMQVLIDPNEFQTVQDKMFASFNNIHTELVMIACLAVLFTAAYAYRFTKYMDVLSLGREQAINLGVDFDYVVKRLLVIVSILISISTALVGPITFLGLLVVNVTYEFLKTYQHRYLIWGSVLMSIVALVGGQLIVERMFTFSTTLSVIINFIGGIYFIYLLLKENRSWSR